jgi:hypothetical protein
MARIFLLLLFLAGCATPPPPKTEYVISFNFEWSENLAIPDGPLYRYLQWALQRPKTAEFASILTEQMPPDTVEKKLKELYAQKQLKYELKKERLISGGQQRIKIIVEQLDELNKYLIPPSIPSIISPDGQLIGQYHIYLWASTDVALCPEVRDSLQKGVDQHRWPRMKIIIFCSNRPHAELKEEGKVLSAGTHARTFKEKDELRNLAQFL